MPLLTLDCAEIAERKIKVSLQSDEAISVTLEIEALFCPDEHFIQNILLDGQAASFDAGKILLTGPFNLEYEITSRFQAFVGSHIDWSLNYPFFNSEEGYLGSGVLPVWIGYEQSKESLWFDLVVANLPNHWKMSTSLLENCFRGRIPMEKVAQFFFYASPSAKVFRDANAQLVISESAQLPISEQQIFSFFKKSIACHELVFGPNPYLKAASLLILQSPSNFDELTQKKTFSTGENYTGGIALFGPDRKDVYGKLGHPSYEDFLLGGLHHELGHAYTSAGPAKFKSILYASSGCTREERQMIGENLNGYFNGAIRACFDDQYEFSLEKFFGLFTSRLAEGKRNFSTDLLLFDLGLRRFGASLYWVFKAVIEQKRKHPSPFSSADILLRSAESIIGEALPGEVCDFLLAPAPASYQEYLRSGLKAQGWSLDSLPRDRASAINFILPGFSVH